MSKSNGSFAKTLGGVADQLYRLRNERLALQEKVDAMRHKEKALREHALSLLAHERAESARGKSATITKVVRDVPSVQDWDKVYRWVKEHDALDLFERRIHRQAWRDRVEEEGPVSGILAEQVVDLHITGRRS